MTNNWSSQLGKRDAGVLGVSAEVVPSRIKQSRLSLSPSRLPKSLSVSLHPILSPISALSYPTEAYYSTSSSINDKDEHESSSSNSQNQPAHNGGKTRKGVSVPGWNGLTFVPGDADSNNIRSERVQASISETDRLLENLPTPNSADANAQSE
ncbi:hypothetical protein BDD12DRAFT_913104 [Trichophaea hybrida]|nr:hypothetical protein BDD12DRAFT_913104 [Trichophaea hybrida]